MIIVTTIIISDFISVKFPSSLSSLPALWAKGFTLVRVNVVQAMRTHGGKHIYVTIILPRNFAVQTGTYVPA